MCQKKQPTEPKLNPKPEAPKAAPKTATENWASATATALYPPQKRRKKEPKKEDPLAWMSEDKSAEEAKKRDKKNKLAEAV